jgi:hypothetical protein
MERFILLVDAREHAHILAALRTTADTLPETEHFDVCDEGPLQGDELDAFCERLNSTMPALAVFAPDAPDNLQPVSQLQLLLNLPSEDAARPWVRGTLQTLLHVPFATELVAEELCKLRADRAREQLIALFPTLREVKVSANLENEGDRPPFWYLDSYELVFSDDLRIYMTSNHEQAMSDLGADEEATLCLAFGLATKETLVDCFEGDADNCLKTAYWDLLNAKMGALFGAFHDMVNGIDWQRYGSTFAVQDVSETAVAVPA